MKVHAVRIEDISESMLESILQTIAAEKKNKINKFIFKKDKIRAIISEILLKTVLVKDFGMNIKMVGCQKNEYGKPYLEYYKNVHFNISHSGDFVVCVIDNEPVGIDIEQILDIDYKSIAESFFSQDDINFILNGSYEKKIDRFYEIWTLKESYIKAKGMGLVIPLNSFGFKICDNNISLINDDNEYIFKQFEVFKGYKLSVCSRNKRSAKDIIELNQNILINEYYKLIQNNSEGRK